MAIEKLTLETKVTVRETLSGSDVDAANITRSQFNSSYQLTPSTSVPISKYAAGTLSLIASGSLDLTALVNTPLATQNMNGLRVQVLKLKSKSTNFADVLVQDGASNGYGLAGATFSFTLSPGQEITFYGNSLAPLVAAADKTIDFTVVGGGGTGTGTDNTADIEYSVGAG